MGFGVDRRIKRPNDYKDLYVALVNEEKIFSTFKDLFVFCMALGYKNNFSRKSTAGEQIPESVFDNDDNAILTICMIAIKELNNDLRILAESIDGRSKEDIAEEYARGGIELIAKKVEEEKGSKSLKEVIQLFINEEIDRRADNTKDISSII